MKILNIIKKLDIHVNGVYNNKYDYEYYIMITCP